MDDRNHFCHPEAPDGLKAAVNDITRLQQWVKRPRRNKDLEAALDAIYIHHHVQRGIVESEIKRRESDESRRLSKLALFIAAASFVVSAIAFLCSK